MCGIIVQLDAAQKAIEVAALFYIIAPTVCSSPATPLERLQCLALIVGPPPLFRPARRCRLELNLYVLTTPNRSPAPYSSLLYAYLPERRQKPNPDRRSHPSAHNRLSYSANLLCGNSSSFYTTPLVQTIWRLPSLRPSASFWPTWQHTGRKHNQITLNTGPASYTVPRAAFDRKPTKQTRNVLRCSTRSAL